MEKTLERLDHPVVFAVFVTMVVLGTAAIFTYAGKRLNIPGLAAISQHP